jgi:hypothetical protein
MAPNVDEGAAPRPTPAYLEAWRAPLQRGAQPRLVQRQRVRPNPPSALPSSRFQPGATAGDQRVEDLPTGGVHTAGGAGVRLASGSLAELRFRGFQIPRGAFIRSASLRVTTQVGTY